MSGQAKHGPGFHATAAAHTPIQFAWAQRGPWCCQSLLAQQPTLAAPQNTARQEAVFALATRVPRLRFHSELCLLQLVVALLSPLVGTLLLHFAFQQWAVTLAARQALDRHANHDTWLSNACYGCSDMRLDLRLDQDIC